MRPQVEERQEVVELVFKHIEECEALEKKRYAGKNTEARVELFAGGRAGGFSMMSVPAAASPSTEAPAEVKQGT